MKKIASKFRKVTLFFLGAVVFSFSIPPVPATGEEQPLFRHAVFFKFKEGTPENEIVEIEKAFVALKARIDTIASIEWGRSESVEGLNDGFTHCFFVTFRNKAGLEAYIPHPAHEAFVAILKPKLEKVFVFDYTPQAN